MTKEEFLKLIQRIKEGHASDQDIFLYLNWFSNFQNVGEWDDAAFGNVEEIKQLMENRINQQIDARSPKNGAWPLWSKYAAAACILLSISIGGYYLARKDQFTQTAYKNDIAPGHNRATLTLADGQKIVLSKGLSQKLAQGTTTVQIDDGITYIAGKTAAAAITFNTLATGTGEQSPYPLILPDGSKVWLNAQSSITFPTAFTGKERIVKMTGEALFEVAHNAAHSFIVKTETQTIEDIGTTFDVNAYTDEPATQTTLIEGKVKVNNMLLEPGQQSDGRQVKTVNTNRYVAWRNGDFYFENDNIRDIMRELARWYNIEVDYSGKITREGFTARISRTKNISAILHILENTKGVHFIIDGKRVTVLEQ